MYDLVNGGHDFVDRSLANRTGDHTRVTKTAAARAAAHDLDRRAIMHRIDVGHNELGEGLGQGDDNSLQNALRYARFIGRYRPHGAVVMVFDIVEARHVHALNLGDFSQLIVTGEATNLAKSRGDFNDDLLTFANDKGIDEIRHRLGIEAGVPARDDQGIAFITIAAENGHAGQINHVQGVGVELLVWQTDAKQVKFAHRSLAFQRIKRDLLPAHDGFHIKPGRKDALRQHIFFQIDLVVEIHDAQIGHAQIVNVGEGQSNFNVGAIPILDDAVVFTADIATGFFHLQEAPFQISLNRLTRHQSCSDACHTNLNVYDEL